MKKLLASLLVLCVLFTGCAAIAENPGEPTNTTENTVKPQPAPSDASLELSDKAIDLMKNVSSSAKAERKADEEFTRAQTAFGISLLRNTWKEGEKKNTLVSPLSAMFALAMTANGAAGDTLLEMQNVLGGSIPLGALNEYLNTYSAGMYKSDECKVNLANSIWFRDDGNSFGFVPKDTFLRCNADYYGAAAYKAPFDATTVKDINSWIETNTNGYIKDMLEKIDDDSVMFLINALVLESPWASAYDEYAVFQEKFTCLDGKETYPEFLHSEEDVYLEHDGIKGFMKNYSGDGYAFVGILPPENSDFDTFVSTLDAATVSELLASAEQTDVNVTMPEFTYECNNALIPVLKGMGMNLAFEPDSADFSGIGEADGKLYIGGVMQNTFIDVSREGTKAAAATIVTVKCESVMVPPENVHEVVLDRPFVYMIVDTEAFVPLFCGAVTEVGN